jgi:hypothetical protein
MVLLNFLVSLGQWVQEQQTATLLLGGMLAGVLVYHGLSWVVAVVCRKGPRL